MRDRASYLVEQDKLRFVFTSPLGPEGEIAEHVHRHGDGVQDIAFWVDDARSAYQAAMARGASSAQEPTVHRDDSGEVVTAAIRTYGDTIHSIVERRGYRGLFFPGFVAAGSPYEPAGTGLKYVDHCVGNVELGRMNAWVKFYEDVLGFTNILTFDDKQITTEYSALMSKVMANGNGRIKFPINEPAKGKKKSQIDEYLDFYRGPGVQHIAIATDDIVTTVRALKSRGLEFLSVPKAYYDSAPRPGRAGSTKTSRRSPSWAFSSTATTRATCCRSSPSRSRTGRRCSTRSSSAKGAKSFGAGNFKALFEAIEREQALRGNL